MEALKKAKSAVSGCLPGLCLAVLRGTSGSMGELGGRREKKKSKAIKWEFRVRKEECKGEKLVFWDQRKGRWQKGDRCPYSRKKGQNQHYKRKEGLVTDTCGTSLNRHDYRKNV